MLLEKISVVGGMEGIEDFHWYSIPLFIGQIVSDNGAVVSKCPSACAVQSAVNVGLLNICGVEWDPASKVLKGMEASGT